MKILYSIFIILLFSTINVHAQSKLNYDLAKKSRSQSNELITVFVKGDPGTIKYLTEKVHGSFKYSSGNIAAIKIPASALSTFVADKKIERIEAYPPHFRPMNDTMLVNSKILPVHNGQAPLPQGYDGSGVIVGIIDTGIDFNHADLRDSTGNTRIKFLWDQTQPVAANTPSYGYGQEWNNTEIDAGLANAEDDVTWLGHGTHVSGVACGNGLAPGNYKGAAPKADIVFVTFDFYSTNPTIMTDAVDYIYNKADSLHMPCVINASLGDYYGSHDGLDLQAQLIKNMIDAKPGRAFVAAAGNAGNVPFHLGYNVTSDTNFTYFNAGGGNVYIQMWADTADFNNVDFAIGADKMSPPYSFRGNLPFSNISSHLGVLQSDTLFNSGNRIGTMQSYGDLIGGVYSMEYYIVPDSTSYNWRLMMTGSGKFDVWSFDVENSGVPSMAIMPDSIFYKYPDLNQTMVSSYQCLDNVITVANYINRRSVVNYDTVLFIDYTKVPGKLHATSSSGPTRDGRIKPDIAAPGDFIMSCSLAAILPGDAITYPDYYDPGAYHTRGGGTSAASPGVAGIAALYLQANPTATGMEVKNAIINCPTLDNFTGTALPDSHWGYGKVNAFGAMTFCGTMGTGSTETKPFLFNVYPNPQNSGSTINISLSEFNAKSKNELKVYNSVGQLVKTVTIKSTAYQFSSELQPGIYFCNLLIDGQVSGSKKLIITN
jgi:subtilisin family serine protease